MHNIIIIWKISCMLKIIIKLYKVQFKFDVHVTTFPTKNINIRLSWNASDIRELIKLRWEVESSNERALRTTASHELPGGQSALPALINCDWTVLKNLYPVPPVRNARWLLIIQTAMRGEVLSTQETIQSLSLLLAMVTTMRIDTIGNFLPPRLRVLRK